MARDPILTVRILTDAKKAIAGVAKFSGVLGGIAVGAVIKDAVKLEAAFSKTMATLAASTGATSKEVDQLRALAMQLGADTAFSANEAADAMLELAKAGITTKDIMEGAADGTLLLATAGGTDLATAATIASNAMNAFNLKGSQMSEVAAALAGGANASSASVESLGEALQQVGPGAVNAGLSLQETVAALSAFDAAGVKGSDAGTSLKTFLARLVPATDRAATGFEKLGLSSDATGNKLLDQHGNFKSLTEIAGLLQQGLKGLSDAERTSALNAAFGSDASRAAIILGKEGAAGLREYIAATNDQGAAQRMADAAMSGTAGALERLSGAYETLNLAVGQAVAPAVQGFATMLSERVLPVVTSLVRSLDGGQLSDLGKWGPYLSAVGSALVSFGDSALSAGRIAAPAVLSIGKALRPLAEGALEAALTALPPLVRALGVALKVVAVAFAETTQFVGDNSTTFKVLAVVLGSLFIPLLIQMSVRWALATARLIAHTVAAKALAVYMRVMVVATKAWAAAQWLLNIAMTANPIGLVIAAVIGLGVALVLAYKKSETFRNIVNGAFAAVKTAVAAVVGWFRSWVPAAFAFVVGAVRRYVSVYRTVVVTVFRVVTGVVRTAVAAVRSVVTGGWSAITGVVSRGANAIVSAVRGIPGRIRQAGSLFLSAGKALMGKLLDGLKAVGKVGVDIGRNLFNGIIDGINAAIRGVNDFLPNKITIPGPVPDIDLPDNPLPTIPRLARGGVTTGPTLAVVGDNPGGREAIIPLDRYPHLLDRAGDREIVVEIHQTIELDGKVIDQRVERVVGRQARKILTGAA